MALQLILGGSGSGKTTYLYDEVIRLSDGRIVSSESAADAG